MTRVVFGAFDVCPLWVPEVLLLVSASDASCVVDEVGRVDYCVVGV